MRKHSARHTKHKAHNISIQHDIDMIKRALYDTAKDVKNKTNDAVSDSIDSLKSKGQDIESNVSEYVSDHPLKSLGLAALSGIFVGMYLIRRK